MCLGQICLGEVDVDALLKVDDQGEACGLEELYSLEVDDQEDSLGDRGDVVTGAAHLSEYLVQPLERPVQVHLDPTRR